MTNVTLLTKELIDQFQEVVGRRVTAEEYMTLRKQAILEVNAGYFVSEPVVTKTQKESLPDFANPTQMSPDSLMSSVTSSVMDPVPVNKTQTMPTNTATKYMDSNNPIPSDKKPEAASLEGKGNSSNDFFALVNKFM